MCSVNSDTEVKKLDICHGYINITNLYPTFITCAPAMHISKKNDALSNFVHPTLHPTHFAWHISTHIWPYITLHTSNFHPSSVYPSYTSNYFSSRDYTIYPSNSTIQPTPYITPTHPYIQLHISISIDITYIQLTNLQGLIIFTPQPYYHPDLV